MWLWILILIVIIYNMLQDKPANIVVGSQIWVGDIDSVWIDGLVLNITGEDAEIQTSDGRQVI